MPRVIEIEDTAAIGLEECVEALAIAGFDPRDEDSLLHAALQLRRLGNNRTFLGEMIVEELAAALGQGQDTKTYYGPQSIMLAPPAGRGFFMRANIWPSIDDTLMQASDASNFVYGFPHDHNFDFLTLGYFGPGYSSDYYEYDYEDVVGYRGEPVDLRFVERSALSEGKILHYRAHRDIHSQLPAQSLSVSINVMHGSGAEGWFDQYAFDLDRRCIARIVSNGANEALLRIAVGTGSEPALELARDFGRTHSSERLRLSAWSALASLEPDVQAKDALWREAELAGSRLVAAEARLRRSDLAEA